MPQSSGVNCNDGDITASCDIIADNMRKRCIGKHRVPYDGISVFFFSTHRIPHALRPYLSATSVSTKFVEQCLSRYRDVIMLSREYAHKKEAEKTQLCAHLLKLKRQRSLQKKDKAGETDAPSQGESGSLLVEKQLWDIMLRDSSTNQIISLESMRYRQILQDMNCLARGVLVPLELLRHRNHWLLLQEDVPINLADRLLHYRVVVQRSPPVELAKRLWYDLWSLLGAMWRQRERLLGVYSKGIIPADIDGDMSRLPQSFSMSPSLRDAYCKKQLTHCFRNGLNGQRRECCMGVGAKTTLKDDEGVFDDDYAFGPLLPRKVGITRSRHYAIRAPLLSILRSLRLRLWGTESGDSFVADGSASNSVFFLPDKGVFANPYDFFDQINNKMEYCDVAFFDNTVEDMEVCRVPYLSPQTFLQLRMREKHASDDWDDTVVVNTYSDDTWNIAVLTVEFALAGFSLAHSCCRHASHHIQPTSSLFDDIIKMLVVCHGVQLEAAHNFLYAALYELSLLLTRRSVASSSSLSPPVEEESNDRQQSGPEPHILAREWHQYLCKTYCSSSSSNSGSGSNSGCSGSFFLCDVAEKGLRWTRHERWNAFQAAHALAVHQNKDVVNAASAFSAGDNNCVNESGDSAGCVAVNAAERVLGCLNTPLLPFHPVLCTGAAKTGADVDFFAHDSRIHLPPPDESFLSLQELWLQLRMWRRGIERHAVMDGGYWKDGDAMQTLVFREFLHIMWRALHTQQLQASDRNNKEDDERATKGLSPLFANRQSWADSYMGALFGCKGELPQHVVLHAFFREMLERSCLFSYRTDGFISRSLGNHGDGASGTVAAFCSGYNDDDDDDGNLLRAFPFSHLFLLTVDLISLLRSDIESLNASSPPTAKVYSALDTIVGVKPMKDFLPSLSHADEGGREGILSSVKSVIPTLYVNLLDQLMLVTNIRRLLQVPSTSAERALSLCRYLKNVWAATADNNRRKGGKRCVYVPVPPTLRGNVWGALLQVPPEAVRAATYYSINTAYVSKYDRQLSVDIPRCHQYHSVLASSEGHEGLRHVIKAWLLMNPEMAYWQGLDSVCAILLAVSFTDKPLVLAQLQQLTRLYIPYDAVAPSFSEVNSMEDHLRQLAVLLRYCDPCLSVHLLDNVECRPELFAISWFLTLLSHRLPVGKVCLLWDFLFLHRDAYPYCLTALCLAVLTQSREQLLGNDFSVCLSTLSRLEYIDVQRVVCDAALILRSVPPAVSSLSCSLKGLAEGPLCDGVSYVDVQTILRAVRRAVMCGAVKPADDDDEDVWIKAGLFLVDIRAQQKVAASSSSSSSSLLLPPQQAACIEERVVGALLFPAAAATDDTNATLPPTRVIAQQVTDLLLQLKNKTMAAVSQSATLAESLLESSIPGAKPGCDLFSAALWESAVASHVVLFTHDMTACETRVAGEFALELIRRGTPHVSILLGGFLRLRMEAPHLVVKCEGME